MGVLGAFAAAVFVGGPIVIILLAIYLIWRCQNPALKTFILKPPIVEVKREVFITIQDKQEDLTQDVPYHSPTCSNFTEPFEFAGSGAVSGEGTTEQDKLEDLTKYGSQRSMNCTDTIPFENPGPEVVIPIVL